MPWVGLSATGAGFPISLPPLRSDGGLPSLSPILATVGDATGAEHGGVAMRPRPWPETWPEARVRYLWTVARPAPTRTGHCRPFGPNTDGGDTGPRRYLAHHVPGSRGGGLRMLPPYWINVISSRANFRSDWEG